MAEENTDANTDTESIESTESSSDVETTLTPIVDDDGLISTTEYEKPEPVEETTSEDTEQKTDTDTSEDKDFNEHPRFQELIAQKNGFKETADKVPGLEQRISELEKPPESKFNNIMSMEDEQIVDDFTSSPKQFLANFAQQLWSEFDNRQQSLSADYNRKTLQDQANTNMRNFFESDKDRLVMLNDGSIEKYMRENPGHNAMSAYYEIAGDSQYKTLVDEAVKKERDKIYKELKAKGNARSFASNTGSTTINSDKTPEMKNPNKFGGRTNVLLQRMQARQAEG